MSGIASRLAVSNIAWPAEDEARVAAALAGLGVREVEIAPTKVFADPTRVTDAQAHEYQVFWADHGISICAFQSMLFGRPDLVLFGDQRTRTALRDHLARYLELAGRLGARNLVFGSPRNRQVPDTLPPEQAEDIATGFFRDIGALAADNGTCFCLEPNPVAYDCNYVTTATAGIHLVERVNHPGFRLHLDTAGMTLAGDDITESITAAAPVLNHFHISAPHLGELDDTHVDHAAAAAALTAIHYTGNVSIEMRPGETGHSVDRVTRAITLARQHYGHTPPVTVGGHRP